MCIVEIVAKLYHQEKHSSKAYKSLSKEFMSIVGVTKDARNHMLYLVLRGNQLEQLIP